MNQHQFGPNFLGNISSAQAGLIPVGQTLADVNEAITYYEARGASLVNAPAINPAEQAVIDPNFYLAQNKDVSLADVDPATPRR